VETLTLNSSHKGLVRMARNLFDLIKAVSKEKVKWESLEPEDQKAWNNFLISRWFSMEMDLVEAINDFQKYSNGILTSKDYYKLLYDVLPKVSFFLKYVKKKKKIELDSKFIDVFCQHFQLGKLQTFEYITILQQQNPDELVEILKSYGSTKEELKQFEKQIKTIK